MAGRFEGLKDLEWKLFEDIRSTGIAVVATTGSVVRLDKIFDNHERQV